MRELAFPSHNSGMRACGGASSRNVGGACKTVFRSTPPPRFVPPSEEHTTELPSRPHLLCPLFFFNDTATTEIYTLSLHDALPISSPPKQISPEPVRLEEYRECGNSPFHPTTPECVLVAGLPRELWRPLARRFPVPHPPGDSF